MRESTVETHLTEGVEALGGTCEKHTSPGLRGVPDRLIAWPAPLSCLELAELKGDGGRFSPAQTLYRARKFMLGIRVHSLHTIAQVDAYLAERAEMLGQ